MGFSGFERGVLLVFFATHVPITLLIDAQDALPESWFPLFARRLVTWYASPDGFNDSLMRKPHPDWFRAVVACEVALQLPFFLLALRGLWGARQWRRVVPDRTTGGLHHILVRFEVPRALRAPSLLYAAHVATTMVPILAHFALPGLRLPLFGGDPFANYDHASASASAKRANAKEANYFPSWLGGGGEGKGEDDGYVDDGASPRQRLVLTLIYLPYLVVPLLLMHVVLRDFPPILLSDTTTSTGGGSGDGGVAIATRVVGSGTPLSRAPSPGASSPPTLMVGTPTPRWTRGGRSVAAKTPAAATAAESSNIAGFLPPPPGAVSASVSATAGAMAGAAPRRQPKSPFLPGIRSRPAVVEPDATHFNLRAIPQNRAAT